MNHPLCTYLTKKKSDYTKSKVLAARYALPAITSVMTSRAYQDGDWAGVRVLAQDMKTANLATITLAAKHPDVFHPNVAVSRRTENRVLTTVIRLLDGHAGAKSASK